ncbi:uncharacterized protein ATC70_005159 [Mucor velutinosus]|uniref:B30.2/SPRY domain-containing protein n=1 Tax=Mucor velutinosus TaxID=708070 RepID=A0AAN7HX52_9FUNG|nr:hypothetical protein ATC70_005159 [Mucor velutinosus]
MVAGTEGFYAVIIVCLVAFLSLSACLGLRILRRMKSKGDQEPLSTLARNDWQPLQSVAVDRVVDDRTLQAVYKWQSKYPPNTTHYIDVTKQPEVIDKGVLAWRFIETPTTADSEEESNAAIMDDPSSIVFCQGQGSIMANLPVPMQEFSYWEVKVLQLSDQDTLAIGFATKPYPRWRIPGWHRHSIAYHSNSGTVFASDPSFGRSYGPAVKEGDVVGVGYLYQSGTVFFTRNGQNLGKASIGFKYPVHPVIGSIGPCNVSVNFGHEDFLFGAANQREAAFAPRRTSAPPPAYGGHTDDVLFDDEHPTAQHLNYIDRPTLTPPPPSYS